LEDDYIKVPPPSVQRSICESVAAKSYVDVVFHTRVDVAKVSCVMEAMLCDLGVESTSKSVTIIDTHPDVFSLLIKHAREGSLPKETSLWNTPANVWTYLLLVADMYQVERLKLRCASKRWDMASGKL
jgi:speckle-type POZ protein